MQIKYNACTSKCHSAILRVSGMDFSFAVWLCKNCNFGLIFKKGASVRNLKTYAILNISTDADVRLHRLQRSSSTQL